MVLTPSQKLFRTQIRMVVQFLLLPAVSAVLSTTNSETQAVYRQDQYTALEPGETGPGSTIAVYEEISVITCSFQ